MPDIADLLVKISVDTGELVKLQQAQRALEATAGAASGAAPSFMSLTGAFTAANVAAGAIISAASGVANALMGVATSAFNSVRSYESLSMSIEALLAKQQVASGQAASFSQAIGQVGDAARDLTGWIQKVAIESPFTSDDVSQAVRMALAFNFTADEAKRLTQATLDYAAAAQLSGAEMKGIETVLGQIAAKGKLQGDEMLQLAERGIGTGQVYQQLSQIMGKTTAELQDMAQKGAIPASAAIEAITRVMEQSSGAGARAMNSWQGLTSSLDDITQKLLRTAGTPIFDKLKAPFEEFVNFLSSDSVMNAAEAFGNSLATAVEWAVEAFRNLQQYAGPVREVFDYLAPGVKQLTANFTGLFDSTAPVGGLFAMLKDHTDGVKDAFYAAVGAGDTIIKKIQELAAPVANSSADWVGYAATVSSVWATIVGAAQVALDIIIRIVSSIGQSLSALASGWSQLAQGDYKGAWDTVKANFATIGQDNSNFWQDLQNKTQGGVAGYKSAVIDGLQQAGTEARERGKQVVEQATAGIKEAWARGSAELSEQDLIKQENRALANANAAAGGGGAKTPFSSVVNNVKSLAAGAKAAGGAAKKTAEEMARQAADDLKAIADSIAKMQEFLDKGYGALVEGAGAEKIQALSEKLFEMGRAFADQLAAASVGMSEEAVKAADLGGQAIKTAADALKSMVELLPKMWEFSKSEAWAAVQSSPELFVGMAAVLIEMGRAFYEQMAAASEGVQEESVKAAQLLATGIQAASSAITSVISAVKGMWEMYASGLWDEVQANRALLLEMSAWLIDMGREMFNQFAAAAAGVDENAVKAASLLSTGIQAATSAIGATLKLVQDLLAASFDPSFLDALFGETRGQIMAMAAALIDLGREIFDRFAEAAGGVKEKTVAAATLLSNGVKAAADGLKAAADSVRLLLDIGFDAGAVAALTGGSRLNRWVLGVADMLSQFARDITDRWAAAGMDLGSRTVAAAKRLTDGAKAAADGLKSAADSLTLLLNIGFVGPAVEAMGGVGAGEMTRLQRWVLGVSSMLANMARLLTEEWGRVGGALGSQVVVAAERLSQGVKSAQEGIKAAGEAIQTLLDLDTVLARLPSGAALPGWLTNMTAFLGNIALIATNEWGRLGNALQAGAASGAASLASGIKSVADGFRGVLDALGALLDAGDVTSRLPAGGALPGWLMNLTSYLGNIALIAVNEWGRIGAALAANATVAADNLAKGAGSVAGGLRSVVDALQAILDAGKVTAQLPTGAALPGWLLNMTAFLGNIALIMAAEWARIGAALEAGATTAAESLASGAKSVADGLASVVAAVALLTSDATAKTLGALPPGAAMPPWLLNMTAFLGNIALIAVNEWGRIGAALAAGATEGAAALASGAQSVAGGVKSVLDALALLTGKDAAKTLGALPGGANLAPWLRGLSEYLANVALIMVNEWGRIGATLEQAAVDGAGQLATGIGSVSDAVSRTIDTLKKLADWLKKPVALNADIMRAAATLATYATEMWKAVADALVKVAPPTETQQEAVKTWSDVGDFTGQALSMMDALVKLRDWLKLPTDLTPAMKAAAGTLAREWTELWVVIANALAKVAPPTEAQTEAVKAWSDVGDFAGQALGVMDSLVKLQDWLKKPAELTPQMKAAAATLAREWTELWWAIQDALNGITPPTEAQGANVKAWSGVSDFTGQALGMMDVIVKLSDWLKKPATLSLEMRGAAAVLAQEWTELWWSIQQALASIMPPTEAEQANVKAWSGVADFTSQALSMMDSLKKLAEWVKAPTMLTSSMQQAAGILAQEYTQLWRIIQEALDGIRPPTELEQANTKAWAGVADFAGQALGMMDSLKKLDEWLKKPLTLTDAMKTAAGNLAVQFTQLWRVIQVALDGITPPTELEQAGVEAWSKVADAFSIITKVLDVTKQLMEFAWQTPGAESGAAPNTGIPAAAVVKSKVQAAINLAVMMLKEIVKAAEDPTLKSQIDQAAQDATKALNDVAGNAFSVIGGVLGVVKSLFEFGVTNPAGWIQQQGGNNIWAQSSFTAGIPDASAIGAKVRQLMAALQAILTEVRTGAANIDIGTDPAALQTKLSTVEAVITAIASIVAKVQSIAGATTTGAQNFSLRIALAFDIPDINAELAALVINPLVVPVLFEPVGTSGTGNASATTNNFVTTNNVSNVSISQNVPASVAGMTANVALTQSALFGASPV